MRRYDKDDDTAVTMFERTVKRHPDRTAMVMIDERSWTYRELDLFSNAVANYFHDR